MLSSAFKKIVFYCCIDYKKKTDRFGSAIANPSIASHRIGGLYLKIIEISANFPYISLHNGQEFLTIKISYFYFILLILQRFTKYI